MLVDSSLILDCLQHQVVRTSCLWVTLTEG